MPALPDGKTTAKHIKAVEAIEVLTGKMNHQLAGQVLESVARVYEACCLRDMTGQWFFKVVTTLARIERKVEAPLEAFGEVVRHAPRDKPARGRAAGSASESAEDQLLHGPQLDGAAIALDDFGARLAGLD